MEVIVNHPRIVGGKLYAKSDKPQTIPAEHADHWFVRALIKSGDFSKLEAAKAQVEEKVAESRPLSKAERKAKERAEEMSV